MRCCSAYAQVSNEITFLSVARYNERCYGRESNSTASHASLRLI